MYVYGEYMDVAHCKYWINMQTYNVYTYTQ